MAKFCTKCGKELEEGKACSCEAKATKTAATAKTTAETNIDVKGAFNDCVELFKSIFKKPVEAVTEFVTENKFVAGIMMILVTAAAKGLYHIASLYHAYDSVKSDYYKPVEPEYVEEFFKSAGAGLVRYAALALVAYAIITLFLKGKANWKQTVTAVGASLVVVICATLIQTGLIFIDEDIIANIMTYLSVFASAFSTIILFEALKGVAGIDKNKLFLAFASAYVGAEIVVDIYDKLIS